MGRRRGYSRWRKKVVELLKEEPQERTVIVMNEKGWMTCQHPDLMEWWLTEERNAPVRAGVGQTFPDSDRLARLFACASCRIPSVWDNITGKYGGDPRFIQTAREVLHEAVEAAEAYADAQDKKGERVDVLLRDIHKGCGSLVHPTNFDERDLPSAATAPVDQCPLICPINIGVRGHLLIEGHQADLLRCIYGNVFDPVGFERDCPDCNGTGYVENPDLTHRLMLMPPYCSNCKGTGRITLIPQWIEDSVVRRMSEEMYLTHDFTGMPILADALEDANCEDVRILSHLRADTLHARGCHVLDLILGLRIKGGQP